MSNRDDVAAAMERYGWTATEAFWWEYERNPYVYNLANVLADALSRIPAEPVADE